MRRAVRFAASVAVGAVFIGAYVSIQTIRVASWWLGGGDVPSVWD